jgi:hypothetical protein
VRFRGGERVGKCVRALHRDESGTELGRRMGPGVEGSKNGACLAEVWLMALDAAIECLSGFVVIYRLGI